MKRPLVLAFLLAAPCAAGALAPASQEAPVPPRIAALLGDWTGEWEMGGVDAAGAVASKARWSDRMTADQFERLADRIRFKTTDVMTFEGVAGPPRTFVGSEGWKLLPDGTLGAHYLETFGSEDL